MPLRVNPATSKQNVTDWPKLTRHCWRSVSYQWCTKIQPVGSAAPPCPVLFNFHLKSKTFLHRNKSACVISCSYCYEAEIKFVNSCAILWFCLGSSSKKPLNSREKGVLMCRTDHCASQIKCFGFCVDSSPSPNSVFFPVYFSSFLLLHPPFSFLLGVWVSF